MPLQICAAFAEGWLAAVSLREPAGFFRSDHEQDLPRFGVVGNLACKATVMATARCSATATARQVDYLLNSGEAVGDRYQRGASLSKAVGEVVGRVNATGADIVCASRCTP